MYPYLVVLYMSLDYLILYSSNNIIFGKSVCHYNIFIAHISVLNAPWCSIYDHPAFRKEMMGSFVVFAKYLV